MRNTPNPAVLDTRGFAPLHLAGKVPREAAPKSAGLFRYRSPEAVGDALHPAIYCPWWEITLDESKRGRPHGGESLPIQTRLWLCPERVGGSLFRKPVSSPGLPGEPPLGESQR